MLQICDNTKRGNTKKDVIYWKYSRNKMQMEYLAQQVILWLNCNTDIRINKDSIEWDIIYKYTRVNTYNVKYEDSLAYKSPEIALEWDEKHNEHITPRQVSNGSHDIYSWVCSKCGNTFLMKISDRTRNNGSGCPICGKKKQIDSWVNSRTKVKSFYEWCIENNRQDLLDEWDDVKNDSTPKDYPYGSNQKVWWKCQICGNEWLATIYNRRKTRCNSCAKDRLKVPVIQYLEEGNWIEYESIATASMKTGISSKSIRNVLQRKQTKAGGFMWRKK